MSKLAHSDEKSMAEIDISNAFDTGDFGPLDIVPLFKPPRCEATVGQGQWDYAAGKWDCRCSYGAHYEVTGGKVLCLIHAKRWALELVRGGV